MTERVIRVTLDPAGVGTGARVVEGHLQGIDRTTRRTAGGFESLRHIILGVFGGVVVREILRYADAWQTVENRLRLVTRSHEQLAGVQSDVFALAQRTRSDLTATADLYGRLARNADAYGLSQSELLTITEAVNQSVRISGAGAAEAASTVRQFGQALGRGELRGDELISLLENAPRLTQAFAEHLDVPIAKINEMGKAGELTGQILVDALLGQAPKLASEFDKLARTVGEAFVVLRNDMTRFVGENIAGSESIGSGILSLGRGIISLAESFAIAARSVLSQWGTDGSISQAFAENAGRMLPNMLGVFTELPIHVVAAVERATVEIATLFHTLETLALLALNSIGEGLTKLGEMHPMIQLGKLVGLDAPTGLRSEDFARRKAQLIAELSGEMGGRAASIADIEARRDAALGESWQNRLAREESARRAAGGGAGGAGGAGGGAGAAFEEARLTFAEHLRNAGAIGAISAEGLENTRFDQFGESLLANTQHIAEQMGEIFKGISLTSLEAVATFRTGMKSAFDDMIRTGHFSARSLGEFMIAELSRKQIFQAIDNIADYLNKRLTGAQGGGVASILSALTGGFFGAGGFGKGGSGVQDPVVPVPGVRFAASGAYAGAGESFIVGERGRELFVPREPGYIVPNHDLRATPAKASTQVSVHNEFKIDARGSTKDGAEELAKRLPNILEDYGERWKGELVHDIDRGSR